MKFSPDVTEIQWIHWIEQVWQNQWGRNQGHLNIYSVTCDIVAERSDALFSHVEFIEFIENNLGKPQSNDLTWQNRNLKYVDNEGWIRVIAKVHWWKFLNFDSFRRIEFHAVNWLQLADNFIVLKLNFL